MKNKTAQTKCDSHLLCVILSGYSGLSQLLKFLDNGTLMIVIYSFLSLWVFHPGH